MPESTLMLGEALANRCSQVLYRCLEEVGSTKGALYLRAPGHGAFEVVSFYGWPRGTRPPGRLTSRLRTCSRGPSRRTIL